MLIFNHSLILLAFPIYESHAFAAPSPPNAKVFQQLMELSMIIVKNSFIRLYQTCVICILVLSPPQSTGLGKKIISIYLLTIT